MAKPYKLPKEFSPIKLNQSNIIPQLDYSNPLARKMQFVWLGTYPHIDLAKGSKLTVQGNPTKGPFFTDFDGGTDGYYFLPEAGRILTGTHSIVSRVRLDATTQTSTIFGQGGTGEAEVDNFVSLFSFTTSRQIRMFWEYSGGTNVIVTGPVIESAALGKFKSYAVTRKTDATSEVKFYYQGAQIGSTSSGNTNPSGGTNANYNVGFAYGTFEEIDGGIEFIYVANTALTAGEIKSLHENPYQIFKPANEITYFIPAAGGAFTLTADSGTYTYTGTAAGVEAGKKLAADSGAYTYSGTAAGLNFGFVLTADSGSYTYSGTAAAVELSALLTANSGAYTYSGTANALNLGLYLAGDSGAYSYSGTAVALTFASAGNFTLTALTGSYSYSGTAAGVEAGLIMAAATGTYTVSGTAVALNMGYTVVADSGAYAYSGTAVQFTNVYSMTVDSGSYLYTGSAATLSGSSQVWAVQTNNSATWTVQTNSIDTWTIQ